MYIGFDTKENIIVVSYRGSRDPKNYFFDLDMCKVQSQYCSTKCEIHKGKLKILIKILGFETIFSLTKSFLLTEI